MTTTIVPGAGAAPLYTQQGTGTTPGYAALDDRRASSGALQEGVYGTSTLVSAGGVSNVAAADFMVTQRAAGANLSVDINMPAGGFAYVQGDTISGQGLYCVPVHAANINEAIAAADPSNPRVDQVILEVQDNVLDASGGNLARTRVLTGTPTAGATLTNRLGAAALPGSALLLADVLVGAGAASVGNTVIRDRRKWARGAFSGQIVTSGNQSDGTGTFTAWAGVSSSLECSGVPVCVTFNAIASNNTAGGAAVSSVMLDGSAQGTLGQCLPSTSVAVDCGYVYEFTPIAGRHTFQPAIARAVGGTATFAAVAGSPMNFIVEEKTRQNASNNNGVTTG